jgi:two-component system response regulator FlrC
MKQPNILIAEDDKDLAEALATTLELEGYQVVTAGNGTEALMYLNKQVFQLVISDVQMPVMDGFQLLNNIQQKFEQIPVLLMTAYGTIPKAVAAMRAGAVDYLIKPFAAEVLVEKVTGLIGSKDNQSPETVVVSEKMQKLYTLCQKVAKTSVSVLLEGESGVGKEVLARYIHQQSNQRQGAFVAVNCAAIPENMLEAMLFGYEKGAFTGAVQASAGKFEQAQGGTLLLDEITEMELGLQAKLLRVLQEKEVERLGGQKKISLDVRVIATTNRNLKEMVKEGGFREDLYYRLNVFPLKIPPLRERKADILPLAEMLLKKHATGGGSLPVFSPAAQEKMQAYHWPGNVRELENVVQRALILHDSGQIQVNDLIFEESVEWQQEIAGIETVTSDAEEKAIEGCKLGKEVKTVEEKIILKTLQELNGSRKQTAEKLGISPRTLRYKLARMKESGVAVPC